MPNKCEIRWPGQGKCSTYEKGRMFLARCIAVSESAQSSLVFFGGT